MGRLQGGVKNGGSAQEFPEVGVGIVIPGGSAAKRVRSANTGVLANAAGVARLDRSWLRSSWNQLGIQT
jgi:hypothetical protein